MLPLRNNVQIDILASGSRGNAALLRSPQASLLIDAGLSFKELGRRLDLVNCSLDEIQAVLISHAHTDHVRALKLLSRRSDLQIFASKACLNELPLSTRARCSIIELEAGQTVDFADYKILPIATSHDAAGSLAFHIEIARSFTLGWATDLGQADEALHKAFVGCDVLGIEANHDLEMLRTGPYPWFLKQRVASEYGHLSNDQATVLLNKIMHSGLRKVVGLHLSAKNNVPSKALSSLQAVADKSRLNFDVQVAAQDEILPLLDWVLSPQPNAVKKHSNNMRPMRPIL